MSVSVQEADFDVAAEIQAITGGRSDIGGLAVFIGLVRDLAERSDGDPPGSMTLEHYPGMTERQIEEIEADAQARWPLIATRVVHRVGRLDAGDRIVLVIAASAHRAAAFDACQFLIDWLKTKAPFWKLEQAGDAPGRWVDARSSDEEAAARWQAAPAAPD